MNNGTSRNSTHELMLMTYIMRQALKHNEELWLTRFDYIASLIVWWTRHVWICVIACKLFVIFGMAICFCGNKRVRSTWAKVIDLYLDYLDIHIINFLADASHNLAFDRTHLEKISPTRAH